MAEQRKRTRESVRVGKLRAYEALRASALSTKELRERVGVGKETVRTTLYGDGVGASRTRAIAAVLGSSEREVRAVETELRQPPRRKS